MPRFRDLSIEMTFLSRISSFQNDAPEPSPVLWCGGLGIFDVLFVFRQAPELQLQQLPRADFCVWVDVDTPFWTDRCYSQVLRVGSPQKHADDVIIIQ